MRCPNARHIARALADATLAAFKKIPNHGPRNAKLGNACLVALSSMECEEAAAQLGRVDAQIKQPTGRKQAAKALKTLAERSGQTPEDMAELAVPTYGLDASGSLTQTLGDFTAHLRITGTTTNELTWHRAADSKPQKSIPADVKRDKPEELKALQRTAKDLLKMLPAQRDRVERLMTQAREWPYKTWRQRYIEHPLLAQISRRLIWHIIDGERVTPAAWLDGRLVDVNDAPIKIAAEDSARVRIWHPIGQNVQTVTAWRDWLSRHAITQPFKQAHREIYVLTDAELVTQTYSNRFASHIVRQHQFVALCQQRGWKTKLQGGWDGGDATPSLELPSWNLRAEFWINVVGELNAMGVANHLSTDQVRFYRAGAGMNDPLPLSDVPALPFSEVMRDADLFVGVASVGNDPTWQDGGPGGQFATYWQEYSFGNLSESAKTRHAVIERLLPRLKIASRCSLTEKFLVVKGGIRTYKIHLGSGNILMEPNDQYLCIVAQRTAATDRNKLFLPFEGDGTLSIILSKAFLLAEDKKITDETIKRLIGKG